MTLAHDLDHLLTAATRYAFRKAPTRGPGEVEFLKAFFRSAVPRLPRLLNGRLAPLGIRSRVSALYVHQRPYISRNPPQTVRPTPACELGDLLVLVSAQSSGPPVYNALLLQGKVGRPSTWRPSGAREKLQYEVYNKWPVFWWRDRPFWERSDADSRRHPEPAQPNAGAQYLIIRVDRAGKQAEWWAKFAEVGGPARPFAHVLADAVMRVSGRRFCEWPKAQRRIGWDRVIWDLIRSAWAPASRPHAWRYYNVRGVYRVGAAPALLTETLGLHVVPAWRSLPQLDLAADSEELSFDDDVAPPDDYFEIGEPHPWGGGGISAVFIDLRPDGADSVSSGAGPSHGRRG